LALVVSFSAQAASTLPDAGQTVRELQQPEREIKHPKVAVPLNTEDGVVVPAVVPSEIRISVNAVRVRGSRAFPATKLEKLVEYLADGTYSLTELEAGALRITKYYRDHGYFLASAYIPAQDIKDGIIEIAVQEGMLDQIHINNTSRLTNECLQSYLKNLANGKALEQESLDRKLLLLRDTPGVGSIHATLQPGAIIGTSDLRVDITAAAPYYSGIQLDNYGNRYTGENRLGGYLAVNNPLKLGDQLIMRAIATDDNMYYGQLTYQLPIGGDGWHVGASYYYLQYQLGREFKSLDVYGTSTGVSLFTNYPFMLNQAGSLVGSLAYENRSLVDKVDSTNNDKQVQLLNFGLTGNYQDMLNGSSLSSFGLSLIAGQLSMDAISRAADDKTARSNGAFTKVTYMVNRLQRLTNNDTFSFNLAGQWAGDNLNSSDKYSLGGPNGVRAYPQGEASGDEGAIVNLELRHRFTPKLQGELFYDYGHLKINHAPFVAGSNTRTIAGAGVGINAEIFRHFQLNSYVAWSTQGGTPVSEPASAERTPRLWVQLSSNF